MSEIKYILNGKYIDPNGKELGDAPSKEDRAKAAKGEDKKATAKADAGK